MNEGNPGKNSAISGSERLVQQGSLPKLFVAKSKVFEVDGHALKHWEKCNFRTKRDSTCRLVYDAKEGNKFFEETLDADYNIMRCLSTSREQPYFSKYNRFFPQRGHFCCKACGNPLYSHETKFDVEDGWPAFGACVLGSIEIISAEERRSQIEKEDKACVKIQACVRGKICRENVEKMLEEMIGELMKKNNGGKNNGSTKTENNNCNYNEKNLSDESETPKKWQAKTTGSILSRPLGENLKFHTLSCHRCKSYLGDVFAEDNEGNYGEKYVEHHRVNGRSLKYMHANLPKRTMVWSSLLFAGQSQRRQLGLPNVKLKNDASFVPFREVLVRKDGRKDRFDPLSVSDHPSSYRTRIPQKSSPSPRRKKNSVDPLGSVSCHERLMTPTSRTNTSSRRRPMRRGSTNSLVSIEERKTFLETSLKVSFH